MNRVNLFAWFFAIVFFVAGVTLWVGALAGIAIYGTALVSGLPSAMLLGLFFSFPLIELLRYRHWRPKGVSFRIAILMMADGALMADGDVFAQPGFASVHWEVVAVASSLLFVFYSPPFFRFVIQQLKNRGIKL